MLLPILGLLIFGGIACVLLLSFEYLRLPGHNRRLPWSRMLGVGWVFLIAGIGLLWYAQYAPQKNYSWQDGWGNGFTLTAFCIWWVTAFVYFFTRKVKTAGARTSEQFEEDVWPPPPNDEL